VSFLNRLKTIDHEHTDLGSFVVVVEADKDFDDKIVVGTVFVGHTEGLADYESY